MQKFKTMKKKKKEHTIGGTKAGIQKMAGLSCSISSVSLLVTTDNKRVIIIKS